MTDHLICYDIANPARLNRLHRKLSEWALPLQYSVFLFQGDDRLLARYLHQLADIIDPREDDLRCYPLPAHAICQHMGREMLPQGILWSGLPLPDRLDSRAN